MTTTLYVPGTQETDTKKLIMSQQLVAGQTATNTDNIATNTTNIATNTANITALQNSRASASTFGLAEVDGTTITAASGVISAAVPAKAFVRFVPGASPAISESTNVTSVTQVATGKYTVTFTSAFGSANYAAVPFCISASGAILCNIVSAATGSCVVQFFTTAGALGDPTVAGGVVCYGT